MLSAPRLLRLFNELLFVLLGFLLVWVAVVRKIFMVPRTLYWAIVSVAMILLGLRAIYQPGQWRVRWQNLVRGFSLVLVGAVMLAIVRAPLGWVGPLLALAGLLLVLRGALSAILILRAR